MYLRSFSLSTLAQFWPPYWYNRWPPPTPERYAQLPAGLLQADEGVAAPTAQRAPCTGDDLTLLHPYPDVAHRKVVMQGKLRTIQDQQEVLRSYDKRQRRLAGGVVG